MAVSADRPPLPLGLQPTRTSLLGLGANRPTDAESVKATGRGFQKYDSDRPSSWLAIGPPNMGKSEAFVPTRSKPHLPEHSKLMHDPLKDRHKIPYSVSPAGPKRSHHPPLIGASPTRARVCLKGLGVQPVQGGQTWERFRADVQH